MQTARKLIVSLGWNCQSPRSPLSSRSDSSSAASGQTRMLVGSAGRTLMDAWQIPELRSSERSPTAWLVTRAGKSSLEEQVTAEARIFDSLLHRVFMVAVLLPRQADVSTAFRRGINLSNFLRIITGNADLREVLLRGQPCDKPAEFTDLKAATLLKLLQYDSFCWYFL